MPLRRILTFGDPRLQQPNRSVERFDDELDELIQDLFETSWAAPGLGVAAPQVGVDLRLAVVDLSVGENPSARLVFANPQIIEQKGQVALEEGCLSFPGLFTTLNRPRELKISAQDASGKPFELEAEGLLAQALFHEIDHLDGVLLVDHLRGLKKRMFMRRVGKMKKLGVWPAT